MSMSDKQEARRLLKEAEQQVGYVSATADKVRLKIMLAQGWCQVAQADR